MTFHRGFRVGLIAAVIGVGLVACESTMGPEAAANVSVAFRAASPGAQAARTPPDAGRLARSVALQAEELQGSNGTLSLEALWFIVSNFELEQVEAACEDGGDAVSANRVGDDDDDGEEHGDQGENGEDGDGDHEHECEEFEAPPSFVQLPLDGATEPAVTQAVAAGVYRKVEFEIEDIEVDEDDDDAEIGTLFDEIRARFPDWPERASMLATGTFTPTGGTPVPFRVFFEAEIKIEREFDPPLDLTAGDEATVTVVVDPAAFFMRPDGTVLDLSQFDGQLVEFESEMEHGFSGVESEHHGDHRDGDHEGDDGEDGDG